MSAAAPNALDVVNLAVSYVSAGASERPHAVGGVSFSLQEGQVLSLVGESGSGKSTIANALLGLLPPTASVSGSAHLSGDKTNLLAIHSEHAWKNYRGKRISFIPQDPNISLNPVKTIGLQIAEVVRFLYLASWRQAKARSLDVLDSVGIKDPRRVYGSYPHELSGGMRQRVLIAIAIACSPKVIVADEPTSGLDAVVKKRTLDLLLHKVRELKSSLLLITHDLLVCREYADSVMVLKDGSTEDYGNSAAVFASPRSAYSRSLIATTPTVLSPRLQPSAAVASGVDVIEFTRGNREPPLLRIDDVKRTFTKKHLYLETEHVHALKGITIAVPPGDTIGIAGESGSGKSTLGRIIAGLDKPSSGEILYSGAARPHGSHIAPEMAQYVFQNPFSSLNPKWLIRDILSEPLIKGRSVDRTKRHALSAKVLDDVGLHVSALDKYPGELSGGQRQRVAIARALVVRPKLLVLDEPVSALDVTVQHRILQLLTDLRSEYRLTYIFISHDLGVIKQISDSIALLLHGDLNYFGTTEEFFSNTQTAYAEKLMTAITVNDRLPALHAGIDIKRSLLS